MRFRADIEAEKAATAQQSSTYNIKAALWSWVDSLVDYGVRRAYQIYDILNYSWSDMRSLAISAAAASYDLLDDKLDTVKDYARDKANKAYNDAVTKVNVVANNLNNVRTELNNNIYGVRREMLTALSNADSIAGAARAKLIRDLESVVKKVERDALAARNAIKSNLDSAIKLLENSSKAARSVLEKTLNNSLNILEREAKEAREVIEGTLIQIIEAVEDALEKALEDLERTFRGLLDVVIGRVDMLEGWVSDAASWFDTEINKYHDRVVDWIVDAFEDILDRVFR